MSDPNNPPAATAPEHAESVTPWVYLLLELRPGKDPDPIGLFSSEEAAEAEVEWRGAGEFVARTPGEDSRWDQEWLEHASARPVRLVLTRLRLERA